MIEETPASVIEVFTVRAVEVWLLEGRWRALLRIGLEVVPMLVMVDLEGLPGVLLARVVREHELLGRLI